jgi:hypothetical protein
MVLVGVIILLSSIENFSLQDPIWISRSSGQKVYISNKVCTFSVHSLPIYFAGLCAFLSQRATNRGFKDLRVLNYVTFAIHVCVIP